MKMDMDLVRAILLRIEESEEWAPQHLLIDGYTEQQIEYHIYIMIEGNLVAGVETTSLASKSPSAIARRLTWQGHQFLEAARDDGRWQKTKSFANKLGGMTMELFSSCLNKMMLDQIDKYSG